MDAVRFIRRQVRKHPRLMDLVQPSAERAAMALRQLRAWHWYADQRLSPHQMNRWIDARIAEALPTAIGQLGRLETELLAHDGRRTLLGRRVPTPKALRQQAFVHVGLFPATDIGLWSALDTIRAALPSLDGMAVRGDTDERRLIHQHVPDLRVVCAEMGLEPFNSACPWTHALRGKRILLIHPFVQSMDKQYRAREAVWRKRPGLLPEFELLTLRMPLSAALDPPAERTWLERLDRLRNAMAAVRFDVALVGAGGMSLPLVAHAKGLGAVGLHLGGATQLLFGIRGRRWDADPSYAELMTEAWVRPAAPETPPAAEPVQGGSYW